MFKKIAICIYECIVFTVFFILFLGLCISGGIAGIVVATGLLYLYIERHSRIKKNKIEQNYKQIKEETAKPSQETQKIRYMYRVYFPSTLEADNAEKQRKEGEASREEQERKRLEDEKQKEIQSIIDKSILVLEDKYRQKAYVDDYGVIRTKYFDKDLNYFIDNMFNFDKLVEISNGFVRLSISSEDRAKIKDNILKRLSNVELSTDNKNPYAFEEECAIILSKRGWIAETTKKSGDQGVDVVAEKRGKRIVLQCKLYTRPVGNKAVQEVFCGKEYYKAQFAAVVSNNKYTTSARKLAENCGVLLLSLSDLDNLEEKL